MYDIDLSRITHKSNKLENNKSKASWLIINRDKRQHVDSVNRIILSDGFTLIVVITRVQQVAIGIFLHANL